MKTKMKKSGLLMAALGALALSSASAAPPVIPPQPQPNIYLAWEEDLFYTQQINNNGNVDNVASYALNVGTTTLGTQVWNQKNLYLKHKIGLELPVGVGYFFTLTAKDSSGNTITNTDEVYVFIQPYATYTCAVQCMGYGRWLEPMPYVDNGMHPYNLYKWDWSPDASLEMIIRRWTAAGWENHLTINKWKEQNFRLPYLGDADVDGDYRWHIVPILADANWKLP